MTLLNIFASLLIISLTGRQLDSFCCDITYCLDSGKLHCTFMIK